MRRFGGPMAPPPSYRGLGGPSGPPKALQTPLGPYCLPDRQTEKQITEAPLITVPIDH